MSLVSGSQAHRPGARIQRHSSQHKSDDADRDKQDERATDGVVAARVLPQKFLI
jgi:hypothetical protein